MKFYKGDIVRCKPDYYGINERYQPRKYGGLGYVADRVFTIGDTHIDVVFPAEDSIEYGLSTEFGVYIDCLELVSPSEYHVELIIKKEIGL
jgi:hypothetical protein